MKIVPRLNLNKHPDEVLNGSLIDGTNLMISNDNAVVQSEPILEVSNITNKLNTLLGEDNKYNIIYCIPCNKELVIFAQNITNTTEINIYRYSEITNEVKFSTSIEYSGGNIIGEFTYNHDELIIAISEYFDDNSHSIPLRVINFGTFENGVSDVNSKQLNNKLYHPICPEVILPKVTTDYIFGSAYKGWYYIFIRYKISDNTYTQWFNTNACCFVDNFDQSQFLNYWVSKDNVAGEQENQTTRTIANSYISDSKELSIISFKCIIENIDNNYDNYQLGFICVNKSTTKAYKTFDIDKNINTFEFKSNFIEEYNTEEFILNYYNYFNVKSLTTNKGRLYIGNYSESNDNNLEETLKNINVEFNWIQNNANVGDNYDKDILHNYINLTYDGSDWESEDFKVSTVEAHDYNEDDEFSDYYTGTTCLGYISNWQETDAPPTDVKRYSVNDILTINYFNGTEITSIDIKASELIICPFEPWVYNDRQVVGKIYKLVNGELEPIGVPGGVWPGTNDNYYHVEISKVNGIVPKDYYNHTFVIATFDLNNVLENQYHLKGQIIVSDSSVEKSIDYLKTNGFSPEQPYNFFIHFIDKYGKCTNGYNLSYFNTDNITNKYINDIDNILLYCPNNDNTIYYTASIKLSSIPDGYIGYFVSYEKLEKRIKYRAFNGNIIRSNISNLNIYSDEFNFSDSIDFNFDTIDIIDSISDGLFNRGNVYYVNEHFTKKTNLKSYTINSKQLFVADSYNNISQSTRIFIAINNPDDIDIKRGICKLYNSSYTNYYNKETKILIPCSPVTYSTETDLNAKTNFLSFHHTIVFKEELYYNDALKIWQKQGETGAIIKPLTNIYWIDNAEVPWESLQYNNTPTVTFFPITGLNTTDEKDKSFRTGSIVECKNTIDLYQMKYNNSGESAPKTYAWFNKKIITNHYFPKTIRRSNIIQDESQNIAWRKFDIENYKIISENKGNIIKLISIGYYFIAHTQHSMFLFNATDTINSKENGIQLASIDIWDIDYKEVITSNLGFAGIQKEHNGITGEFGYIFYDSDARRIYKYDNNQISYIDNDIVNFIYKLSGYDVYLFDDKLRNRIIFRFYKNDIDDIVLSYNYMTNTFVSRHLYEFYRGWSTKEHTYLINKYLVENNHNKINEYSNDLYSTTTINIMINTNYYTMKYIEFITYNLSRVAEKTLQLHSPVEGLVKYYAGDLLRIYTANCDTGDIDVTFINPENIINSPMDYTKPYWRFGNWHFNALRDKLAKYIQKNVVAEESSRIYGNWFVIKFTCYGQQAVEFESIDTKLINGEI